MSIVLTILCCVVATQDAQGQDVGAGEALVGAMPSRSTVSESPSLSDLVQHLLHEDASLAQAALSHRVAVVEREAIHARRDWLLQANSSFERSRSPIDNGFLRGVQESRVLAWNAGLIRQLERGGQLSFGMQRSMLQNVTPNPFAPLLSELEQLLVNAGALDETSTSSPESDSLESARNQSASLYLQYRQPLLRGAGQERFEDPLRQADARISAQELAWRRSVSERLVELVLGWQSLGMLEQESALRRRALERAGQTLEIAQAEVRAGRLAEVDLLMLRQAQSVAREALVIAEHEWERASARLRGLAGFPGSGRITGADLRIFPVAAHDERDLNLDCALMAEHNQAVAELRAQVSSASEGLPAAEDALRPRLDLVLGATPTGLSPNVFTAWGEVVQLQNRSVSASLSFETPLGNQAARANLERVELGVDAAELALNEAERALCVQAEDLVLRRQLLGERLVLSQERVRLSGARHQAELQRFERGLTTLRETLLALGELEDAELAELRVRVELAQLQTQLAGLNGRLADAWLDVFVAVGPETRVGDQGVLP